MVAIAVAPALVLGTSVGCAVIGGLDEFVEVSEIPEGPADGGPDAGGGDADTPVLEFARVGGIVAGLVGKGLILRNNGVDDVQVGRDGPFTFPARVRNGDPYEVTVGSQPIDPAQTCAIANGKGAVNGADVTDVSVTCDTSAFRLGGTVVGLTGTGLVLANGKDELAVSGNGPFAFPNRVPSGAAFDVTVKTQPVGGGPCVVSGGKGDMGVTDVSTVVVNCAPGTYTVGGTVAGLSGTTVLQLNGGNDLALTSNGSFAFAKTLTPGETYQVTVLANPSYPPRSQTCSVTSGSGTMSAANVSTVAISCITRAFSVGGTVSGLAGTVVLKNNGQDDLPIGANGSFTFPGEVASGNAYSVTIGTQPAGQTCSITAGSGTVTSEPIANVSVSCTTSSSGDNPGVACGGTYCVFGSAADECCLGGAPACASKCTGGGVSRVMCDSREDCSAKGMSGFLCCGGGGGLFCVQPDHCNGHYYCDPTAPNPCPEGTGPCRPADAPAGYHWCW